jgi:hypothetical protein
MVYGVNKCLYKIIGLNGDKKVGTIKVVAHTKLEAYYYCKDLLPKHNKFDYHHIKFVDCECGPILEKNDLKRKK